MAAPPLLRSRAPTTQVLVAIAAPAVAGIVCGVALGVSQALYVVLSVLAFLGGIAAGYEHDRVPEAAVRGLAGGMLYGTFVLFGHTVSGLHAAGNVPEPDILLPVATTVLGVLLGTLGGELRIRHERRAEQRREPA